MPNSWGPQQASQVGLVLWERQWRLMRAARSLQSAAAAAASKANPPAQELRMFRNNHCHRNLQASHTMQVYVKRRSTIFAVCMHQ
eukprot:2215206-Amphidinium_carterae.1